MRVLTILFALAATAFAQQKGAPPAPKDYASSSEVAALIAKAKAQRKDEPLISQRIIGLSGYNASLEYRGSVGTASTHVNDAEMFYVIDGSATLVTGGKLVDEKQTNALNMTGSAIEGGKAQPVAKGDFAIVPENTPHWFSKIDGVLVLMSIHLPKK